MSSVIIKDETDKTLVNIDLAGRSLGKYLKSAASLRTLFSAPKLLASPLSEQNGSRTLALTLDTSVPVGRNAELSLSAGASAAIGIHPAGTDLFDDGDLQAPESVPNGTTYTSLTLEAILGAALGVEAGSISFGFSGGTSIRYGYYHPFDVVGQDPPVKEAVERLLAAAVFPADVDDVTKLPVGSFATIAGEGELTLHGRGGTQRDVESARHAESAARRHRRDAHASRVGLGEGGVESQRRLRAASRQARRLTRPAVVLQAPRPLAVDLGQGPRRRVGAGPRQGHVDDAHDRDQSQSRSGRDRARGRGDGRRVDRSDSESGRRQRRSIADHLRAARTVVTTGAGRALQLRDRCVAAGSGVDDGGGRSAAWPSRVDRGGRRHRGGPFAAC